MAAKSTEISLDAITEQLASLSLTVNHIKTHVDMIEKQLAENKKQHTADTAHILASAAEIMNKVVVLGNTIKLAKVQGVVDGLPPNVVAKETGPAGNMFDVVNNDQYD